jgi:HAE1 family hydrophobic/amphiphilic exporter-1
MAIALEMQEFSIAEINGIKNIITNVGAIGSGRGASSTGNNTASITIVLDLENPAADTEETVKQKLRPHFMNFPNAVFGFGSSGLGAMMGGSDIDIVLRFNDLGEGFDTAETVKRILENNVPEAEDIAVDISEGLPQVNVNIDRERAYNMGLNVVSIAAEIAASMNGVTATTFRQSGTEYNVILLLDKADRYELPDLGRIFVRSSRGTLFPVSNFASFEKTQGPVSINRETQARTIHITAGVKEGYSTRNAEAKIKALLEEDGITATFAGASENTGGMVKTFFMVIILALLLVFGVMAAQ